MADSRFQFSMVAYQQAAKHWGAARAAQGLGRGELSGVEAQARFLGHLFVPVCGGAAYVGAEAYLTDQQDRAILWRRLRRVLVKVLPDPDDPDPQLKGENPLIIISGPASAFVFPVYDRVYQQMTIPTHWAVVEAGAAYFEERPQPPSSLQVGQHIARAMNEAGLPT